MTADLLSPIRAPFRALAQAFVPETATCTPAEWAELEGIVAEALASRPAAMQRQVMLFVRVLDLLAWLRYGRRLPELETTCRTALLEAIGNGPLLLLRRGVWGLRTLVMMGYYAQPAVQAAIGYRASAAGWEARR